MKGLSVIIEPHQDDASLGCFMPIQLSDQVMIVTITDSGPNREVEHAAFIEHMNRLRSARNLPPISVYNLGFVDGNAGANLPELAKSIFNYIPTTADRVYIPEASLHQDHKAVQHASLIALRSHQAMILSYEYPEASSQFYHSAPNTYHEMTDYDVKHKADGILCYQSQVHDLRNGDAIRALAMLRGMAISKKYAEAYTIVRQIVK